MSSRRAFWGLLGVAVASLVLGVYVYLVERPVGSSYLSSWFSLSLPSQLGKLAFNLPSFTHALTFSLFLILLMQRRVVLYCLLWFGLEVSFEFAQHPALAKLILPVLPEHSALANFMRYGTFDGFDILAVCLGCFGAWLLARYAIRKVEHDSFA